MGDHMQWQRQIMAKPVPLKDGQIVVSWPGDQPVTRGLFGDAEMAARKTKWKGPRETIYASGALWKYAQLVGPTNKIIEDLLERRERWGFSYVIVGENDVEPFAPVVAALAGA